LARLHVFNLFMCRAAAFLILYTWRQN